jgi:hypothetical protein
MCLISTNGRVSNEGIGVEPILTNNRSPACQYSGTRKKALLRETLLAEDQRYISAALAEEIYASLLSGRHCSRKINCILLAALAEEIYSSLRSGRHCLLCSRKINCILLVALAEERYSSLRSGRHCSLCSRKINCILLAEDQLYIARCARRREIFFATLRETLLALLTEDQLYIARCARRREIFFATLEEQMLASLAEEELANASQVFAPRRVELLTLFAEECSLRSRKKCSLRSRKLRSPTRARSSLLSLTCIPHQPNDPPFPRPTLRMIHHPRTPSNITHHHDRHCSFPR